MLSNEIFKAMELLNKQDLVKLCKQLNIDTKIRTYDPNGNIVTTKNDYCSFDLIRLVKQYMLNKNNTSQIVYHDYIVKPKPASADTLVTFRNVRQLHSVVKKLYKQMYDLKFEYDKIAYNILSNRWANGELVTVRDLINEHFSARKLGNVKHAPIHLEDSEFEYEQTKKQILSYINEYLTIKYSN